MGTYSKWHYRIIHSFSKCHCWEEICHLIISNCSLFIIILSFSTKSWEIVSPVNWSGRGNNEHFFSEIYEQSTYKCIIMPMEKNTERLYPCFVTFVLSVKTLKSSMNYLWKLITFRGVFRVQSNICDSETAISYSLFS